MAIAQEYALLERELDENIFLPIERVLTIYRRMIELEKKGVK